jgi:hypothetical protein
VSDPRHNRDRVAVVNVPVVTDLSSYLPDSWLPVYVSARTTLLQALHTVGIISGSASRERSERT